MIINDAINRFESNWGVMPTSISLTNDPTTEIGASNIELAGEDWSSERDFGNGLQGIAGFTDYLPNFMDWVWQDWALVLGGGYILYNMVFTRATKFGEKISKRRELLGSEKQIYKNRKLKVKRDYPLFA